ncbi:MAG TPA: YchJ family protein [Methylophaga sp.]|nr:YchJ family protein [Methylophaga sp.]
MINVSLPCPCCSNQTYQKCCQKLHNGDLTAASAEQLMRSRYSAFVVGDIGYLIKTLHPDKRQVDDEVVLRQTIEQTRWLGLKIIAHKSAENNATVEFIAFYQDDVIGQLHERSHFIKQNGQWFYVDGEMLPAVKLSRNDLCFCGSGKKLKKCHSV